MANDIIAATNLLGQRVIQGLKANLPFLDRIATDMRAERVAYNASVTDFSLAAPTVSTYSQATGYDSEGDLTKTDLACTVDQWKYTKVKVTDLEASSSDPGHLEALINRHGDLAAYALAEDMVDAGIATCTVANYSNVYTLATANAEDMDYDDCNAITTTLRQAKIQGPYFGLVNSLAAQGLRGDTVLISTDTNPAGAMVVESGTLPSQIAGIKYDEYAGLTTPGAEKLIGIVGSADGLLFGNRLIKDAAFVVPGMVKPGTIMEHTDVEGTGLSIQSRLWYDMELAEAYVVFAIMYGWDVGKADRLYRIAHA